MPFEPAPKESPAARLAALIELGRALHPDLNHSDGYREWNGPRDEKRLIGCCSMTMAALGAGASRSAMEDAASAVTVISQTLRMSEDSALWEKTSWANSKVKSFDEICLSLREGELAKVTA